MKNRHVTGLATLLAAFSLNIVSLRAQSPPNASNQRLSQAIALLNQGKAAEANSILTNIDKLSENYGQALCYRALCQYAQSDKRAFLKILEVPAAQTAELPPDIKEDMDFNQIDALFYYRKFDDLLPKVERFQINHDQSTKLNAVAEYQLASLHERGMKKLTESAQLRTKGETAGADKRLREGEDNLGRYLKLAADSQQNGYQTLTNRDLTSEAMKTLAALGGENETRKLVPTADPETTAFAFVELHRKIDANADAKLQRMTKFLSDFPSSSHRKRVELDMARVADEEGNRLTWAWPNRLTNGEPYLAQARELLSHVTADPLAGITEADAQDAQVELLGILYSQNDWDGMEKLKTKLLPGLSPGSRDWIATKLYHANGLTIQKKLTEAATELDEILATGFKGIPTYDGLLFSAAQWRIGVAAWSGDKETVQRIGQLVENSACYGSRKRAFAEYFQKLPAIIKPSAK